jgi:hypothetical protein
MSDDIQPVAPAENEEPVEQAPVADVAAPVVEAADSEEVLEEISAKFDDLLAEVDLEPSLGDRLREVLNQDISDILSDIEFAPINWDLVAGVRIKDGVDGNHRHHEVMIGRVHSLEMAQALFASGLYDLVLKED